MIRKTVCELFAGVGGFRLGLERSSKEWETVWANQWEPGKKAQHAFDCYCYHFGRTENHVNEDISKIDKKTIPITYSLGDFHVKIILLRGLEQKV